MPSHRHTSATPDNLYLPRLARIIEIRQETGTERSFVLRLQDEQPFDYLPGQFVMVSVFGAGEIPLGLASSPTEAGHIMVTCRRYPQGQVTSKLHERKPGEHLGIRGPMGNAFPLQEYPGADLVLIAGGVGLPTLRSALVYALDHRAQFGRLYLLYGAVRPADRLYKQDLEAWVASDEVQCLQAVDAPGDEPWPYHVGFVTELVGQIEIDPANALALMCGPPPMVKPAANALVERGMDPQRVMVNMEANMQCGVGKCGHCALGDKYVCVDGPVFSWDEVQRLREP